MNRRSAFPAVIRSFHLPRADEMALQTVRSTLSPESERNLGALLHLFGTEVGTRRHSFGYSPTAATSRWMLLASTQDSDEVIGYAASVTLDLFGQCHGLITDLAVLPEYRRQGVAQSLIVGVGGIFAAHQDPRVTTIAAIVPARRHSALDTFIIAGFEVMAQGDECLFHLPINHRAPAHC